MKIGDRVTYAEEHEALGLTEPDLYGTVAEPTAEERNAARGGPVNPYSDVMVEWSDGERLWEDPNDLVRLQEAES